MDGFQLRGNFGRFKEMWAVDFEFQDFKAGDHVRPVCMTAEDLLSGRQIRFWRDEFGPHPPFDIGDESLFISYSAGAEFSCFLVLGWEKPVHILDLYVEFIALRNGRGGSRNPSLLSALEFFGKKGIQFGEKIDMRKLILERTFLTRDEQRAFLEYCYTDVVALRDLLPAMVPHIKRPWQAALRGDFMWSIAVMEHNGIPFNVDLFYDLKENWDKIQNGLIARVDQNYGVYRPNKDGSFSFSQELFDNYLVRNEIGWPILDTGELETTDAVFEERAKTYPQLLELRYLREALGKMRLFDFPVGLDGFNRCWLNPFGSKTGRNQPGSSQFIFGAASWMRHLVQPPPGYAISVLDWSNQEFAIAAYLSGDPVMIEAYESGDPYIYFGKFAGAIPANAILPGTTPTEAAQVFFEAWDDTRSLYKTCVLSTQYFIGARSLSVRIDRSMRMATELLRLHREAFHVYWDWVESRITDSFEDLIQETVLGWPAHISDFNCKYKGVGNFFCQANGAEMMRLAAIRAVAEGLFLCCPIHDAFLIMSPIERIAHDTEHMREIMFWASSQVTGGRRLRCEVKTFKHPRFFNKVKKKARVMWHKVRRELKAFHQSQPRTISFAGGNV
jgi:hypothetical protein